MTLRRRLKDLPIKPHCTQPNFAEFDADISAGKITISDAWRSYAAHAPKPSGQTSLIQNYRLWQASEPANEVAEFAASEAFWKARALPGPAIIVLDEGATLRLRGGMLVFNQGETRRFLPATAPHRSTLYTGSAPERAFRGS